MKSIRQKITVCLMATVVITLVLVGSVSMALSYRNTVSTVDQMLSETAILAAERISQELTAYKNVAMDTGCIMSVSPSCLTHRCRWRKSAPWLTNASVCTAFSAATLWA